MARLRAVVISQPAGLAGTPSRGQRSAAMANASCGRVLGEVDVAEDADQRGQHAAPLVAEDGVKRHGTVRRGSGRTSIARAGSGLLEQFPGDGQCPVEVVGLDQDKAGEVLLAVDERSVGQQRPSASILSVVADSSAWSLAQPVTLGCSQRRGDRGLHRAIGRDPPDVSSRL